MIRIIALIFFFSLLSLLAQCATPVVYNLLKAESHNYHERQIGWYIPMLEYIGYPQDSVYIGIGSNVTEQLEKRKVTADFKKKYRINGHQNGKLRISVCDTNIIKMMFGQNNQRQFINCYPVVVRNIDTIPIEIAIRKISIMFMEKRSASGIWKTVNESASYDCTTGDSRYFIMPGEIAILPFPVTANSGYNAIRFRIGQSYSNIIDLQRDR